MIIFTLVQFPYIVFVPEGVYFGNLLLFIVLLNLEQIVHKCTLLFQHSVLFLV